MSARTLKDLQSVGPKTLEDFALLGIDSLETLRKSSAHDLYDELCRLKGQTMDPCCLDVFACAIAQAQDPQLPEEQRKWWYWSHVRKNMGL